VNNEQLESCLRKLKSSSCEPDVCDDRIEEKIMKEHLQMKSNRGRMKRVVVVFALLLLCGAGFVVAGADATVMNYFNSNSERDANGNPVQEAESLWTYMLRHVHDHLRHIHGHGPKDVPKTLIEMPGETQAE